MVKLTFIKGKNKKRKEKERKERKEKKRKEKKRKEKKRKERTQKEKKALINLLYNIYIVVMLIIFGTSSIHTEVFSLDFCLFGKYRIITTSDQTNFILTSMLRVNCFHY